MKKYTEKLFSYGTLQYDAVQLSTFGRKLMGTKAILPGFKMSTIEIHDPHVIATSGENIHKIITRTENINDQIEGMVFDVSEEELQQADTYEVSCYKRVQVSLLSGELAWVYISI